MCLDIVTGNQLEIEIDAVAYMGLRSNSRLLVFAIDDYFFESLAAHDGLCLLTNCRDNKQDCLRLLLLLVMFGSMHILVLFALHVRMLDCQTPDVEVIADGCDDIVYEAAVDTKSETEHKEYERNLIDVVTKRTVPQTKTRSQTVANSNRKRDEQYILERELIFHKMPHDHLSDTVRVDDSSENDERH